ncbi:unnamed protein product [Gemmataceae bacterium]|nr:unnamed protein product [Gemmataceae bacterium]VTU02677.1 unnamed protein product [Gemmataceae bacterium]
MWCLGTAVGAAYLWPLAGAVARLLVGRFPDPSDAGDLQLALLGALFGSAVGTVAAPLLLRPRLAATLFWVPALGVSGAVGSAAIGFVARAAGDSVPGLLSSSLGFGLGGALAGLAGFVWAHRHLRTTSTDVAVDIPEVPPKPATVAATTVASRGRIGWVGLVRLVPLTATAGCSMAFAVRVGVSDEVSGVLIGVVGLSVTLTMCDHEERLRRLEAGHTSGRPGPSDLTR